MLDIVEKISLTKESFSKGSTIYSPVKYDKKIGFILSGECIVRKSKSTRSAIPLNYMYPFDSFGIVSVISECDEYPTEVIAKKDTEVLFINRDDFVFLVKSYGEIALNVAKFLTKKIVFLNDKISAFSADNVEQKLANYLLQLSNRTGKNELVFKKTQCAKSLNIGRASLYRAIDSLLSRGLISTDDKMILINNRLGLERISK